VLSETDDNEIERTTSLKLFAVRLRKMAVATDLESPSSNETEAQRGGDQTMDGCSERLEIT
jgi:hypothetical protein